MNIILYKVFEVHEYRDKITKLNSVHDMSFMKTALGKILENREGADNTCLKYFSLMLQNLHYKLRSLKFTLFVQQLYIF